MGFADAEPGNDSDEYVKACDFDEIRAALKSIMDAHEDSASAAKLYLIARRAYYESVAAT